MQWPHDNYPYPNYYDTKDPSGDPLGAFSPAERCDLIARTMEAALWKQRDATNPIVDYYYGGAGIQISNLLEERVLSDVHYSHNVSYESKLNSSWTRPWIRKTFKFWFLPHYWLDQNEVAVANQFGNSTAFYFAFLKFYTIALIPMAVLGIACEVRRDLNGVGKGEAGQARARRVLVRLTGCPDLTQNSSTPTRTTCPLLFLFSLRPSCTTLGLQPLWSVRVTRRV